MEENQKYSARAIDELVTCVIECHRMMGEVGTSFDKNRAGLYLQVLQDYSNLPAVERTIRDVEYRMQS